MSVFIIAEAGVNHNGSVDLAKQLIDVASDSGANAVKFQTFKAENLVVKNTQKAEYQKQTTNASESQFNMIKRLELDVETHKELIAYCQEKNIIFLSTPFDHDSINLLNDLNLQIFKIPSGEITNLPYLRHIGTLNKEVILSTGMSNLQEVEDALTVLISAGTKKNNITDSEMLKTFNCGVGFCLIANKRNVKKIKKIFSKEYQPYQIGFISMKKSKFKTFGKLKW